MYEHIFHVVSLGGASPCWTLLDGKGEAIDTTWDSQGSAIEAAKQRALDVGWAHIDVFDEIGGLEREFIYGPDLVERPPWPGALRARSDTSTRPPRATRRANGSHAPTSESTAAANDAEAHVDHLTDAIELQGATNDTEDEARPSIWQCATCGLVLGGAPLRGSSRRCPLCAARRGESVILPLQGADGCFSIVVVDESCRLTPTDPGPYAAVKTGDPPPT